MRTTLSIYMDEDDVLLHADMWIFPTRACVVNTGLGESNLLNIAGGLAKTGKNVYIYGVAGFIIHRYEQLKFSCNKFGGKYGKIIICNAGKYGYESFGAGHVLDDDIGLMKLLDVCYYTPSDIVEFINILNTIKRKDNGLYYIQLGRDYV